MNTDDRTRLKQQALNIMCMLPSDRDEALYVLRFAEHLLNDFIHAAEHRQVPVQVIGGAGPIPFSPKRGVMHAALDAIELRPNKQVEIIANVQLTLEAANEIAAALHDRLELSAREAEAT